MPSGAQDAPADKEACLIAHEKGQVARKDGAWAEAREQLERCTRPECPEMLRQDCTTWREELDAAQPTLVFSVIDEVTGEARRDVVVREGERIVQQGLDGRALAVDPGEHAFVFELGDGRRLSQRVMVAEGVKNRQIVVRVPDEAVVAAPGPRGMPVAAWILGGVGLAGLAGFAILGGVGLSKEAELQDRCAPECATAEVDEVRRLYAVGDVMGAVGLAAVAGAVIVVLVAEDRGPSTALGVSPHGLSITGRF